MLKKPSLAAIATVAIALAFGCVPAPGGAPAGVQAKRGVTVKGAVSLQAGRRLLEVIAPYTAADVGRLEVYLSKEGPMPSWDPMSPPPSFDPMDPPSGDPSPFDPASPPASWDPSWPPMPPGDDEPVPEWQTFMGAHPDVYTPIVLHNLKMDTHYRVHLRAYKSDGMGGWKRIDKGYMDAETEFWTTNDDLIEGLQFNLALRDQEFRGTAGGGVNVAPGVVVDTMDPEGLVAP